MYRSIHCVWMRGFRPLIRPFVVQIVRVATEAERWLIDLKKPFVSRRARETVCLEGKEWANREGC